MLTPALKQSVAFDLDYLAYVYDEEGREQWRMEWRTERVYLVYHSDDKDYIVRRFADDKVLGAGDTKSDACSAAYYTLMEATYRKGAPLGYLKIGGSTDERSFA